MYKNILYPIDIVAQEAWEDSLPIVKEYVKAFDAKLHIMASIPDHGMSLVSQFFPKDQLKKVVTKTQKELRKFVEENLQEEGINIGKIIVKQGGSVYQSIIDVADSIKADLIMVSASNPKLKDYLLGPNSAKVVRHSRSSVLVMRY